ncbi:peptide-methionine (S)-S-oxide reductase, partial [Streptomyces anulatus]
MIHRITRLLPALLPAPLPRSPLCSPARSPTRPNTGASTSCAAPSATGHTETALVAYDPTKVSEEELLKIFWERHDPTQGY